MKRTPFLFFALLLLALTPGCLEFERQTMSFRHDPAADTLLIFQDYQGIFGADDPAQLSETEREQLTSVLQGQRTFFFSNWLTDYNRDRLLEIQQKPKGELDDNPAYEAAIRALADLALANVKIENVGFYLNAQQRLSGSQRVTVRNASKILAALNQVLRFVARDEAAKDEKSAEERKALLRFADSGQPVLRLDGNRIEIRWPATEADYRECKDDSTAGRAFQASGGEIRFADGILELAIGKKDAPWNTLTLPMSEKPYAANAVPAAEKHGIKESFDAESAARAFFK